MNAVGAIRQIILDDAVTVALLANNTSVYPVVLPQSKTYPAITLQIGDDRPENYKWTPTAEKDRVEMVVGIWAKEYTIAQQIDTAVRNAIDGFVGNVTTDDSVIHYIFDTVFQNRKDGFDQENVLFYREVSYFVTYARTVPALPVGQTWSELVASLPRFASDEDAKNGIDPDGNATTAIFAGDVYLSSNNHKEIRPGIQVQVQ